MYPVTRARQHTHTHPNTTHIKYIHYTIVYYTHGVSSAFISISFAGETARTYVYNIIYVLTVHTIFCTGTVYRDKKHIRGVGPVYNVQTYIIPANGSRRARPLSPVNSYAYYIIYVCVRHSYAYIIHRVRPP